MTFTVDKDNGCYTPFCMGLGYWYQVFHIQLASITGCPHPKSFGSYYPSVYIHGHRLYVYFDLTPEKVYQEYWQLIDLSKSHKLKIEQFEESPGNWIFQICVDNTPCKTEKYNHPGKRDIPLPQMNLYLSGPCWEPMRGIIHSFGVNLLSTISLSYIRNSLIIFFFRFIFIKVCTQTRTL